MGLDQMGPEFEQLMDRVLPGRTRRKRISVPQALELLVQQEIERDSAASTVRCATDS